MTASLGQALLFVGHAEPWQVVVASMVSAAGVGLVYTHLAVIVVSVVPDSESGSASGTNTNIRNIGGSVGTQVVAVIPVASMRDSGYPAVFAVLTAVGVLSIPVSVLLARATRP